MNPLLPFLPLHPLQPGAMRGHSRTKRTGAQRRSSQTNSLPRGQERSVKVLGLKKQFLGSLLSLAIISHFTIGCQTVAPDRKLSAGKPMPAKPLPAWTKQSNQAQSDQQLLITTKLIEITRPAGSSGIPAKKYERTMTAPQFQMFLREIAQKKGVDLLAAPSVVTRDGQIATAEVIRKFAYPVVAGENTKKEVENVGVTSRIEARHLGGKNIAVKTFTRVSEFDGFASVTPEFELPVFKRRDIEASARLKSGETIIAGGILDEISQETGDTGPFGIIRKRPTEPLTRELVVAVTATLVKPDGTPLAAR